MIFNRLYYINKSIRSLTDTFIDLYSNEYGYKSCIKGRFSVECCVYNLCRLINSNIDSMIITTKEKYYTKYVVINGSKIKTNVGRTGVTNTLTLLHKEGYIKWTKGHKTKYSKKNGSIEVLPKFKEEFYKHVNINNFNLKIRESVVILLDEEDNPLAFDKNTGEIRSMIDVLENYNKFMSNYVVTAEYGKVLNTHIARIFNNTFEYGGRLYVAGTSYQAISSVDRRKIKIDGIETAEVDIKGSHISMLYHKIGCVLAEGFDPYHVNNDNSFYKIDTTKYGQYQYHVNSKHNPVRNLIKIALMVMINASSKEDVKSVLLSKINKFKNVTLSDLLEGKIKDKNGDPIKPHKAKLFGLKYVNIDKLLDLLCEVHSPIKEYFFSGVGVKLQKIEGDIFTYVCNECINNEIPVLIVHDSCRCKREDVFKVGDYIKQGWEMVFGDTDNLSLEYEVE